MLCFLSWAWVRSITWNDAAAEWYKGRAYTIGQGSGSLYLVIIELGRNPDHPPAKGRGTSRSPEELPWVRPAFERKLSPGLQRYRVAHWVLLLLFFLPWSGFLASRWLRSRRLRSPGRLS